MPTGTVKYFNNDKGFGFIKADDGSADVFCHTKECGAERGSYLEPGDAVSFEVAFDEKKGKDAATMVSPWRPPSDGGGGGGDWGGKGGGKGKDEGDKQCRDALAGKCNRDNCKFAPCNGRGGGASRDSGPYGQQGGGYGAPQPGYPQPCYGVPPLGFPQPGFPQPGFPQPGFPPFGSPQLPPGWEQIPDPASGRPYFCNRSTGETSWTPPAAPMPGPTPSAAPAGALPPGWESATDPASGKQYFFNRATNATSWTPPTGPPAAQPAFAPAPSYAPTASLPPGWEETKDPASGKTYYFNRATNATQWTPP